MNKKMKFIDLFAGLGGIRIGFEQACKERGIETECVLTSEIKPYAVETLKHNHHHDNFIGDIFQLKNEDIPDFDFLFGGFPCQPFSAGGKRNGFADTRGTLFFEVERIIRHKKPQGFILENVEGLVKHDLENKTDKIGRTLKTILYKLEEELNYKVTWEVLDSVNFGVPQSRKRIFIVGTKKNEISLKNFIPTFKVLKDVLETGKETMNTDFTKKLLSHFSVTELYGKSIKDKRGGANNIHSWDIGVKGECSKEQIRLLNKLFKVRRQKHWAIEIGIDWMDGMPLTLRQIETFAPSIDLFESYDLKGMLDDLVDKGYLRFEYPKKLIKEVLENGIITSRVYDETKSKGYNIVTGKLSFEINKILNPNDIAPTLVATDMSKIVVVDGKGVRKLTIREGLRIFGYPDSYEIPVKNNFAYDLLGNTVAVPVLKAISERILDVIAKPNKVRSLKLKKEKVTLL
ncbi:DNA (cytosine-5-)-methyltransferase [Tenacibaculum finnmarkense]|uniref:Cytosine-specific methyltransferase n=3 Tax=Tenacibaculum finnmarkense TaxID=2781243 RepID=A0AAP1WHE9_9FLAO|nr:DNA (cytosine-5-)-methyltransferase [Tenacibaculum finnmarkense genomovar finnmarkense]MCG8732307.1 DNA (cytosine-5-)-methyltransferase [Tenacibaculum finnmarkense]MBE7696280.1 DNA (cytosine-5-)-methyltransferase [Tenacibaculum finnmarkense genomovar finnmarkense]MCG8753028.1 DNA (cytosine-5-)-methyltransferase [Tenacibaculum finnmarkense]MCG8771306.1 DNA (cytosine-5-)-methyltransferase [Tenacibaculum finnmarkense]